MITRSRSAYQPLAGAGDFNSGDDKADVLFYNPDGGSQHVLAYGDGKG